ncbi:MAG TPA: RNA polymerase sigma factor [Gemmatales bacterium]|nr:RNA polymerase sigma factor [Gemmatales bacterium]
MKVERPGPTVEELVPLYYTALYRYAYRLTGNCSDAEDLTQETFCSAQAKRTQLREPERVKSWLFSILHNAFLVRQRKHRQASFTQWEECIHGIETRSEASPLVESAQLQSALLEVPDDFRAVLILYYFEEFSYRDMAEQLKVPIGTVMSRLARAKQFLKAKLVQRDKTLELEE